jgi:uncharacterized membrane protein
MEHMNPAPHCRCHHHKIGAILVVLLGIVLLLQNLGTITMMMGGLWIAILVIVFGLTRLMGGSCKCYMHGS